MKKSKRVKKSNSWKIKQHRDQFFKKSKTLGYRSRASFKLIELIKNINLLKKYQFIRFRILPRRMVSSSKSNNYNRKIMSIDIKDMEPLKM